MSDSFWQSCQQTLKILVSNQEYEVWLSSLKGEVRGDFVVVACPNKEFREKIFENFKDRIEQAIQTTCKEYNYSPLKLKLHYPKQKFQNKGSRIDEKTQVNKTYTFSNFVAGTSNEIAYMNAQNFVDDDTTQTLYIYGESSTGKTHLLNAVGNAFIEQNPDLKILSIRGQTFLKDVVDAIGNRTIGSLSEFYSSRDIILMDDVHYIKGDRVQEELHTLIENFFHEDKRVLFVSEIYIKENTNLHPRIKNRILGGRVVQVSLPDYETRVGILREFTRRHNKEYLVPGGTLEEIAKRAKLNARKLESLTHTLTSGLLFERKKGTEITRQLALNLVEAHLSREVDNSFSFEKILEKVCFYFSLNANQITSSDRTKKILLARQICMYICRKHKKMSLADIGLELGNRSHATVLSSCHKIASIVQNEKLANSEVANHVRLIEDLIRN